MTEAGEPASMFAADDETSTIRRTDVRAGPVTVTRTVDRRAEGFVAWFTARSGEESPAQVTISQRLPDTVQMDLVTFYPDHRPETGSIEGHTVVAEGTVSESEPFTYQFGPIDADEDADEVTFPEPEIEVTDDPISSEGVSDASAEARSGLNGLFEEASSSDGERVVDALVEALREDRVSDEQRSVLREELGTNPSTSTDVRFRHLQSRLEDVVAYADAMEEFLDEEGTAKDVLDELRAEVDAFDSDLDEIRDTLDTAAAERDGLEREVGDITDEVDRLVAERERLDDQVTALTEEVESLREEVADMASMRAQLAEAFTDVGSPEASRDSIEGVSGP